LHRRERGVDHAVTLALEGALAAVLAHGDGGGGRDVVPAAHVQADQLDVVVGPGLSLVFDDGPQLRLADLHLAVRDRLEALEGPREVRLLELDAHAGQGVGEPGPAGVLPEDDLTSLLAHGGGVHDLVCLTGAEHAVLVDARLVGEGVAAHDRLVVLDRVSRELGDQPRRLEDLGGVGADLHLEDVLAGLDRHDDLLDGGVTGPFADSVDRPFDLAGTGRDRRQRVRHGQAEVAVAVDRYDDVVAAAPHLLVHPSQQLGERRRGGAGDAVGDAEAGPPRLPRLTAPLDHDVGVGAGGVLGGDLDVVGVLTGPPDAFDGGLQQLVGRHPQHLLHVDGGGRHEDVDPEALGCLQRLVGLVDVVGVGPGQAGDHGAPDVGGDAGHRLEVAGGGGGETRFQYVYSQLRQLMGDGYFLVRGQGDPRGLLPIAQGRVEDDQTVSAHQCCSSSRWSVCGGSNSGGRVVLVRRPATEARGAP